MPNLIFNYETWDINKDVQLACAGTAAGLATINGSLPIGRAPTVRQGERDKLIGPVLDGVIGVLAGSIEWLRERGLSDSDVQAKVTSYMANNRGTKAQAISKTIQQTGIYDIADGHNIERHLDKTKILG